MISIELGGWICLIDHFTRTGEGISERHFPFMFNFNVIWPLLLLPLLRVTSLSFRSTISAGGRWTIVGKPRHLVTSSWMWHHPLMSHCCDIKHIRLNIFEISVRKTVYGFPVQLFRSHTIHVASTGISNYHQISIAISNFPPSPLSLTVMWCRTCICGKPTKTLFVCLLLKKSICMSFVLELLRMMDGDDLQVVWKVSGLGAQREGLGSELAAEQSLAWWKDQHWSL